MMETYLPAGFGWGLPARMKVFSLLRACIRVNKEKGLIQLNTPRMLLRRCFEPRQKGNTGLYVHRNHSGLLGMGKLGDREF